MSNMVHGIYPFAPEIS